MYFGKHEEQLVAEYLKTRDPVFYEEKIHPLLGKIAYGVCLGKGFNPRAYFTSRSVIEGCRSHMWETLLFKYDPSKGKKAYSYLTAVAYNYFCGVSRKMQKASTTLFRVAQETQQLWSDSHISLQSAEEMMIEIEELDGRRGVAKHFIDECFDIKPRSYKAMMRQIEASPKNNKKDTLRIMRRFLRPKKKIKNQTKWMRRKKFKFANEYEAYKKEGVL